MDMQTLQELGYSADRDYREGSPHLNHWQLYDELTGKLREVVTEVIDAGLAASILEVGAGHGGYTEPALATGAEVTATEMSRPSVARVSGRFATNPHFQAVFDPDGTLDVLGDRRFSVLMCSSVLHHIPDYLAFLHDSAFAHITPGGCFFSFQDPLWYPTVGSMVHRMDRWSHLAWRVSRGNYRQGFATFARRLRGVYDPENPADMVEYHVVRQGVDHEAIRRLLEANFATVELGAYWSTASSVLQWAGERLNRPNTFYVVARGYRGVA